MQKMFHYLVKADGIYSSTDVDAAGTDAKNVAQPQSSLGEHYTDSQRGWQGRWHCYGDEVTWPQDDVTCWVTCIYLEYTNW